MTHEFESPATEIAALRTLIATIRRMDGWNYDGTVYLGADTVRTLIDDFDDHDDELWVVFNDTASWYETLADPTQAAAEAAAAAYTAEYGVPFSAVTLAEAKPRHAAAEAERERKHAAWMKKRDEERAAEAAHAAANPPQPRFVDYDFTV